MWLTITQNMDGWSAGHYDHEGRYGHVIYGEMDIVKLKAKARNLGYKISQIMGE